MPVKGTTLTPRQINLIEYMVAHPNTPGTTCAHECGVANSTYFFWRNTDLFNNELRHQIQAKWKDSERTVVEAMIKSAQEGNVVAQKYILDNLGYLAAQKVELSTEQPIQIKVTLEDKDANS